MMEQDPAQVLALEKALAELRQKQPQWVEALEYRLYYGFTLEDTACRMGVNEKTIRRWVQAALPVLAKRILEILNDEEPPEDGADGSAN